MEPLCAHPVIISYRRTGFHLGSMCFHPGSASCGCTGLQLCIGPRLLRPLSYFPQCCLLPAQSTLIHFFTNPGHLDSVQKLSPASLCPRSSKSQHFLICLIAFSFFRTPSPEIAVRPRSLDDERCVLLCGATVTSAIPAVVRCGW